VLFAIAALVSCRATVGESGGDESRHHELGDAATVAVKEAPDERRVIQRTAGAGR